MYAIIPLANWNRDIFGEYSIASPDTWAFEKDGIMYGGFEDIEFSQDQINEILAAGGEWFENGQEFNMWLNQVPAGPVITIQFNEGVVTVINVPVDYSRNRVTMTLKVETGEGEVFKQFVADNSEKYEGTDIGEWDYLFNAVDNGISFNDIVRMYVHKLYNEGELF